MASYLAGRNLEATFPRQHCHNIAICDRVSMTASDAHKQPSVYQLVKTTNNYFVHKKLADCKMLINFTIQIVLHRQLNMD